jgi:hypothetical protein
MSDDGPMPGGTEFTAEEGKADAAADGVVVGAPVVHLTDEVICVRYDHGAGLHPLMVRAMMAWVGSTV